MKPVIIIGGGFSGIISLKICLENGLEAQCYERLDKFGGLWRYREHVDEDGVPSVTKNTIIDTSKEISALSDFPPPDECPNYMHNARMIEYLGSYIRANNLEQRINYNHEILKIQKSDNYQDNGEWKVTVKDKIGDEEFVVEALAVLVCTGHHAYPNYPTFSGQDDFQGPIIHSHSLKGIGQFEGKRILVVGVGNSAMDAAAELSFISKQVYLSTRQGVWIIPRMGKNGYPSDYNFNRINQYLYDFFPNIWRKLKEDHANSLFDHTLYGLKPNHRIDQQHITVSDIVPPRILAGAIVMKGDIVRLTSKGVIFKGDDENKECEVDAVIVCTGYNVKIPFLPDDGDVGLPKSPAQNDVSLYERMFPVQFDHPTLAFIGMCQPNGPLFPLMEIQTRWICRLLTEPSKRLANGWLASSTDRAEEVARYKTETIGAFVTSQRHTLEINYIPYMDNLAKKVGCMPNLLKIAFTDPLLFYHLLFGPAVAYQFRLEGSHKWLGARAAILRTEDRIQKGLGCGGTFLDSSSVRNPFRRYSVALAGFFTLVAICFLFIIP